MVPSPPPPHSGVHSLAASLRAPSPSAWPPRCGTCSIQHLTD